VIWGCDLRSNLRIAHHSYSGEANGATGENCHVYVKNAGKSQLDVDVFVYSATIKMY